MNAALQRKAEEYSQAITCNDHGRAMALLSQFGEVAYQQGVEDTLAKMSEVHPQAADRDTVADPNPFNDTPAPAEPNVLDALFTDTPNQES